MLIQFMADMLNDKPTVEQTTARSDFARDPEGTMARYSLSEEQKSAIRSRNPTAVAHALSSELEICGKTRTNW